MSPVKKLIEYMNVCMLHHISARIKSHEANPKIPLDKGIANSYTRYSK